MIRIRCYHHADMIRNAPAISHVVIRDHLYVAGTSQKPEVGVFVQTHTKQRAINEDKIAVGQTVWMKWNDGPIVAKSEILSWHTGVFRDGNINVIRAAFTHLVCYVKIKAFTLCNHV